jgi:putative phosphoribosyl transferase
MMRPRSASATRLADRREAGRRLAERLLTHESDHPVVLALPRGGVPVAFELARRLRAPLDVLIVRKVGAPDNPEYGLGAVVEGGRPYLDEPRIREAGYTLGDLAPVIAAETLEVERRAHVYHRHRARVPVGGREVILTDDGVATGGTVLAAIQALRSLGVRRIVLALGVAPASALPALSREADEVYAVLAPENFRAVGEWYDDFSPVTEEEVLRLLRDAETASYHRNLYPVLAR